MTDSFHEQTGDERRDAARKSLDAFARHSTALIGVGAQEASAASLAYIDAKNRSMSPEEAERMMAAAVRSTAEMKFGAFDSEIEPESRKGFWVDILAGLAVPAGILLFIWLSSSVAHADIDFRYIALSAIALLMAALYLRKVLSRSQSPRFIAVALGFLKVNSTLALNSAGALAVGAGVVLAGGGYLIERRESINNTRNARLSADLNRVDAAIAMTLAARFFYNTEPRQVAKLVEGATGLDWTIERNEGKEGGGLVLARANLQDRPGKVLVHYVHGSAESERVLQSELQVNGKPVAVGNYLYGIVEPPDGGKPVNLREMRLRLEESSKLAVLRLPANTLPPAPGTEILARESESESGVAESIQYVDDVRKSLLIAGKGMNAQPSLNK